MIMLVARWLISRNSLFKAVYGKVLKLYVDYMPGGPSGT